MDIPLLGNVTKDERLGSLCSAPIPVRVLQDGHVRLILEGYEEDGNPEDFHSAINSFLSIGPEVLTAAEAHVFSYYRDVGGFWDSPDEPVCIGAPNEVWAHVQFGVMPIYIDGLVATMESMFLSSANATGSPSMACRLFSEVASLSVKLDLTMDMQRMPMHLRTRGLRT